MVTKLARSEIRAILIGAIVLFWLIIAVLETGSSKILVRQKRNVVNSFLPQIHMVQPRDVHKTTNILLYSRSEAKGVFTLDSKYFERLKCPIVSCILTTNRSLVSIHDFDAIVFSHNKIKSGIGKLPSMRSPTQNYILHLDKPSEDQIIPEKFASSFNTTMSYLPRADIWIPNGHVLSKSHDDPISPDFNPNWKRIPARPKISKEILSIVEKKTKIAAWISLECPGPDPKHLSLIGSLQQQFRLDIAGPCGDFRCYSMEDCLGKVEKEYKFLVHLEDFFSKHYISTDTFFVMRYTIVPILFGSVSYNRFLPRGSYVNAKMFTSAEKLGKYVNLLDSSIIDYILHFWWKSEYYIHTEPNYCALCAMARQFRLSGKLRYYENVNNWLNPELTIEKDGSE